MFGFCIGSQQNYSIVKNILLRDSSLEYPYPLGVKTMWRATKKPVDFDRMLFGQIGWITSVTVRDATIPLFKN